MTPTRRHVCAGLAGFGLCCIGSGKLLRAALAAGQPLEAQEVRPGAFVVCGVHEEATRANLGAIGNAGFVVGMRSVAVIDTGGCRLWGDRFRALIGRNTGLPVSHVVLTHMHPDHVLGAGAFAGDGVEVVAHARLPEALAARRDYYLSRLADELGDLAGGTEVVMPTALVHGRRELDLGGRVLRLEAHSTAHTDNDLSVLDLGSGLLWTGDLLFVNRVPALDGSLTGWLKVLRQLKSVPARQAVPGHGPALVPWPAAAADEERYLDLLLRELRALMAKGGDIETAVATVGRSERNKWLLFDDYNGRNVTAAYKELEWE